MKHFKELHIYFEIDQENYAITRTIKDEKGKIIFQRKTNYLKANPYTDDPVCILEDILQNGTSSQTITSLNELSDTEIRLRTLELVQRTYSCHNPFELIARSIALARYAKTGKYNRSSGNVTGQIGLEYMERIYDQLTEKRYEPKQTANNTNDKPNVPKTNISLFKKLFSRFRNK